MELTLNRYRISAHYWEELQNATRDLHENPTRKQRKFQADETRVNEVGASRLVQNMVRNDARRRRESGGESL